MMHPDTHNPHPQHARHHSGTWAHPPKLKRKRGNLAAVAVLIWLAIVAIAVLATLAFTAPAWAVTYFGAGPGMY